MSSTNETERSGRNITIRLRRSWLRTTLVVAVTAAVIAPLAAYAADRFSDVPDSNIFHDDITWLADADVTRGCNPPSNTRFCPDREVTRAQMAAFLRRLAEGQVVDAGELGGRDLNEVRYPSTLDGGETVRGHFGFDSHSTDGTGDFGGSIDFGIDTGGEITVVYVPSGDSNANCSGSDTAPEASAGYLCIYETTAVRSSYSGYLGATTRYGVSPYFAFGGTGDAYVYGSWAVTAPMSTAAYDPSGGQAPSDGKG